jgi:hypothetical protein
LLKTAIDFLVFKPNPSKAGKNFLNIKSFFIRFARKKGRGCSFSGFARKRTTYPTTGASEASKKEDLKLCFLVPFDENFR